MESGDQNNPTLPEVLENEWLWSHPSFDRHLHGSPALCLVSGLRMGAVFVTIVLWWGQRCKGFRDSDCWSINQKITRRYRNRMWWSGREGGSQDSEQPTGCGWLTRPLRRLDELSKEHQGPAAMLLPGGQEEELLPTPAQGTEKAAGRRWGSREQAGTGAKMMDPQSFNLSISS